MCHQDWVGNHELISSDLCIFFQQVSDSFGVAGDHGEVGARRSVGAFAGLLPIAQGSDGDAVDGSKGFLRQAEAFAELLQVGNVNETWLIEKTDRRGVRIIAYRSFNLFKRERLDGSPVRICLDGRIAGIMLNRN